MGWFLFVLIMALSDARSVALDDTALGRKFGV